MQHRDRSPVSAVTSVFQAPKRPRDGVAKITAGLFGTFESKRRHLNCAIAEALQRNAAVIVDFRHVDDGNAELLNLLARYKKSFGERVQLVVRATSAMRDGIDAAGLARTLAFATTIEDAHARIEHAVSARGRAHHLPRIGVVAGGRRSS